MVLNHRFWLKDNVQKLEIVGGGGTDDGSVEGV